MEHAGPTVRAGRYKNSAGKLQPTICRFSGERHVRKMFSTSQWRVVETRGMDDVSSSRILFSTHLAIMVVFPTHVGCT